MKADPDINFEIKKHIFPHLSYEIFVSIAEVNLELICWPNHAIKVKRALLFKFTKSLIKTTFLSSILKIQKNMYKVFLKTS